MDRVQGNHKGGWTFSGLLYAPRPGGMRARRRGPSCMELWPPGKGCGPIIMILPAGVLGNKYPKIILLSPLICLCSLLTKLNWKTMNKEAGCRVHSLVSRVQSQVERNGDGFGEASRRYLPQLIIIVKVLHERNNTLFSPKSKLSYQKIVLTNFHFFINCI